MENKQIIDRIDLKLYEAIQNSEYLKQVNEIQRKCGSLETCSFLPNNTRPINNLKGRPYVYKQYSVSF